ncbi:MAG: putative rhamnosyl transferase [Rhodobacteraceae bacterium]|nr:putative rhamnosyl transferase [Paracoccaceae bacterium]
MGRADNQIIGVCRFSFLATGGFRAAQGGLEAQKDLLFDPERMRRRFAYFESLCLPSLAAQTDPDFILVLLVSDLLPQKAMNRLFALRDAHPFLRICVSEPMGPLQSSRRAFRRGLRQDTGFVTGFRIDDDDAVAVDYIARTRALADHMLNEGWAGDRHPVALAFSRGLYWHFTDDPEQAFYDVRDYVPLGQASAMISPVDARTNIFRFNHRHLPAYLRTWIDPEDIMFIRGVHEDNDSGRSVPRRGDALPLDRVKPALAARFGLDPDAVIAAMDAVHGRVS